MLARIISAINATKSRLVRTFKLKDALSLSSKSANDFVKRVIVSVRILNEPGKKKKASNIILQRFPFIDLYASQQRKRLKKMNIARMGSIVSNEKNS